jgi:AraC family 4-hydroxyphenylacetate 3-monooxygenase operon regulatory protein
MQFQAIPDIHIGRVYNRHDPECDLHYETFAGLAEFFGRNTPPHRHYCFYQLHLLVRGSIRLNLDGRLYSGDAPLLIFTPPNTPHSFYTEEDTDGHVLTVRQEVVRSWHRAAVGVCGDGALREPCFIRLEALAAGHADEFEAMVRIVELLREEFMGARPGRAATLLALGQCVHLQLARLLAACPSTPEQGAPQRHERGEDLRIFLEFCDLVEAYFRDHLALADYAGRLCVTVQRLNDICRRMADRPSKEIVHERVLQEARRLLMYSAMPVSEISYQLGFADPGYFSRFFTKRFGCSPSQFRETATAPDARAS